MNIFFHEKNKMLYGIGFIIYSAVILFLVISLVSYNSTDSSWFYVSSDPQPILNQMGFFGAHIAAILYYLCGGAAFLLLIPLICFGIALAMGKTISNIERLIAALALVPISAMFLTMYAIDVPWSPYPGGFIGLYGVQKLDYYFDPIGRILFLYISLFSCLIILLRWTFMFLVQRIIAMVSAFYSIMKKYRVINKIINAIRVCIRILFIKVPVRTMQFIYSLFTGDAFEDTDLLYPQEEYEADYENSYVTVSTQEKISFLFLGLRSSAQLKEKTDDKYFILDLSSKIKIKRNKCDATHAKNFIQQDKPIQKIVPIKPKKTFDYALPHKNIFIAEKYSHESNTIEIELQERAHVLQDKLKRFGVHGEVIAIKRGPVVTLFEYQPDVDTKLSKIIVLEDDLAMALQAMSIRIIAPIPGRSVVGFEVSNTTRHDVLFSQIVNQEAYTRFSGSLPLVLGKGTVGEPIVVDLARMPHLLIAGSTGSGKSVALNAILISLLCKLGPDDLKFILIDPKRLEFAAFTDIAHLLFPIVTNPVLATSALRWVVQEMEERYEKMAQCGARNIADYNEKILAKDNANEIAQQPLPFIVVVIDELADLMITAGRDIEDLITRITQMARAAGIHMIVATQRPSVDVITGLIKANFPSRISFRVASRIDSRTILDTTGADRLLGRGDMLFIDASTSQLKRVHGAYVSDQQIEQVADHIRKQRKVEYRDLHQVNNMQRSDMFAGDDTLYKDVCQFLDEIDEISISLLQRKFRIGYNRSARIIDLLESQGLIMSQDGSKTRKVIR